MVETVTCPVGADPNEAHAEPKFALGTLLETSDGKEYVYCVDSGSGVTGAGYAVVIDEAYSATMTSAALAFGDLIGIPQIAVTADYYFWAQRKGAANVRVAASAAANTILNATSTGGQLDDNDEASTEEINGLVLTTANGGGAAVAPAMLNYPTVGAAAA